ncbi:MAG: hypothetical protein D6794_10650 [Deltaproteobacteria bacterium]|nr:MAG: hypothetical protein D6794_10650 [Deltaproteobacteria bacterium]
MKKERTNQKPTALHIAWRMKPVSLLRGTFILMVSLTAAGCSSTKKVTFVTATVIGLDADTRTQTAGIGYSRVEGISGPAYENGGVPPVYARLESNLSVFSPRIDQLYATGAAARIVANDTTPPSSKKLIGTHRTMFFGTASHFGLQLGFGPGGLQNGTLGYKRIEFSLLPVLSAHEGGEEDVNETTPSNASSNAGQKKQTKQNVKEDIYPSVIASITFGDKEEKKDNNDSPYPDSTKVRVPLLQFFATGDAAVSLAELLRPQYQMDALKSVTKVKFTYGPDDNTKSILEKIKQNKSSETGSETTRSYAKDNKCRDILLDFSKKKSISPTIILYASGYEKERKKLIDIMNNNQCDQQK